jgi:preprotein translocase subunit SecG
MANVLIVAYLLIVLALIAVILIQRSEGGGLGMGSGNAGGLMTVRGSANLLTRTTAILATLFMATAIGLTILAEIDRPSQSILDGISDGVGTGTGAGGSGTVLDALNQLQSNQAGDLPVPPAQAPAPAGDSGLNVPQPAAPAPAAPSN